MKLFYKLRAGGCYEGVYLRCTCQVQGSAKPPATTKLLISKVRNIFTIQIYQHNVVDVIKVKTPTI